MTETRLECYYCKNDCKLDGLSSCSNATYCWKGTFRVYGGYERYRRGCLNETEQMRFYCDNGVRKENTEYRTECCTTSFCNGGIFPILEAPTNQTYTMIYHMHIILYVIGLLLILCPLGIFLYYFTVLRNERVNATRNYRFHFKKGNDNITVRETLPNNESLSSGSGSGSPVIKPRTLSQQILLYANSGNFSSYELWRGIHQDQKVMVKIYSPLSESLWAHEIEVYTKLLPSKHSYILDYVGNDASGLGYERRLWLVTDDHPKGSLIKYLRGTVLEVNGMVKAINSLVNGLSYLHDNCMAHRNLSSKTVFVKNYGECAIGGLEHTITPDHLPEINFFNHVSKRYMSPELLDPRFINGRFSNLETYQKADIYSLALIMWEICCMYVEDDNVVVDYVAPFSEWLGDNVQEPTVKQMRDLILGDDERRPRNPDHWNEIPVMMKLALIIEKCWDTNPDNRPPIEQIKTEFKEHMLKRLLE